MEVITFNFITFLSYKTISWFGSWYIIKMSSVMPFAFNAVELYVVFINEKPWTRAREVCKALEYNKKTADLIKAFCSQENYNQKH